MDDLTLSWHSYLSKSQGKEPADLGLQKSDEDIINASIKMGQSITLTPNELQTLIKEKTSIFITKYAKLEPIDQFNFPIFLDSLEYQTSKLQIKQILIALPDLSQKTLLSFMLTIELLPYVQADNFQLPGLNFKKYEIFKDLLLSRLSVVSDSLVQQTLRQEVYKQKDSNISNCCSTIYPNTQFINTLRSQLTDEDLQEKQNKYRYQKVQYNTPQLDLPSQAQIDSIQRFLERQNKAKTLKQQPQPVSSNKQLNISAINHSSLMHINYQIPRKQLLLDIRVEIFDGKYKPLKVYTGESSYEVCFNFCRINSLNSKRGIVLKKMLESVYQQNGIQDSVVDDLEFIQMLGR